MQRQITQLLRVISFFTACFFSLSAFAAQVAPQSNDVGKVNQTLRLYYLTFTQENPDSRLIERTVEVLSNVLSYRVDVHPVNLDEMHAAYSARRGDIWISTSGFFWEVHAGGASTIATMATPEAPNPNEAIAGAILVHKDRRDLRNLEDLRGKRAVTTSVQAFMNAQTSLGEIAARGYDPEDFFAEIREIGRPMRGVLEAVANGSADAALVKAGIWESLALAGDPVADSLRVISPRSGDSMRLLHTSGTYPGWTIFAAPKLDPHVARDVSFALYSLSPSLLNGAQWLPATEFERVDALFKTLRYGPYDYLRHWTVGRVWEEFWPWIVLAASAVVFGIFHDVRNGRLVRAKTRSLADARQRLENMHRASLVAQFSSIVAHELLQPIGAAQNFCVVLRKSLETSGRELTVQQHEQLISLCGRIEKTVRRMGDVIQKVRAFAKSDQLQPVEISLDSFVPTALEEFRTAQSVRLTVKQEVESVVIRIDPVELKILLFNLLKNAQEATLKTNNPFITLSVRKVNDCVELCVVNATPRIAPEAFERMKEPLHSMHAGGLGLGIAIIRSIVERADGQIAFELEGNRMKVKIVFPFGR